MISGAEWAAAAWVERAFAAEVMTLRCVGMLGRAAVAVCTDGRLLVADARLGLLEGFDRGVGEALLCTLVDVVDGVGNACRVGRWGGRELGVRFVACW